MQVLKFIVIMASIGACQPQRKTEKTGVAPEPAPAVSADQEPRPQTCLVKKTPARLLSETGCVDPKDPARPAASVVPYDIVAPLWSDGSAKQRYLALPVGQKARFDADGHLDVPVGSVTIKHFELQGRPVETRLYMKESATSWQGYSYEWRDDGSDAVLLEAGKEKDIGGQTWVYPSPRQCESCHSQVAQVALGLSYGQLSKKDQIATLEKAGVLEPDSTPREMRLVDYNDINEPIDARARSYLQGNCAYCHQPKGSGLGGFDLRIIHDFASLGICNKPAFFEVFPVTDGRIYKPGVPSESILLLRMKDNADFHMPPQVSRRVDTAGVD
ncbi:MAG: hypothetical protein M3Q07_07635, partial [Pseudobdellovibrionaceae bacterium]|nr:hypothetical protein [Pseudobdellovibrionaceae bacterium]